MEAGAVGTRGNGIKKMDGMKSAIWMAALGIMLRATDHTEGKPSGTVVRFGNSKKAWDARGFESLHAN